MAQIFVRNCAASCSLLFRVETTLVQQKVDKECEKSRKSSTLLSSARKKKDTNRCYSGSCFFHFGFQRTIIGGMSCFLRFSLGKSIENLYIEAVRFSFFCCVYLILILWTSFTSSRCTSAVRGQECGKSSTSPALVVAQKGLESPVPDQFLLLHQFGTSKYVVQCKVQRSEIFSGRWLQDRPFMWSGDGKLGNYKYKYRCNFKYKYKHKYNHNYKYNHRHHRQWTRQQNLKRVDQGRYF